jgi:hypothetical protein
MTAQRQRPDFPYVVARGGTIPEAGPSSISSTLNELFRDLVAESSDDLLPELTESDAAPDGVRRKILRIFESAHLEVVEGVKIPAIFHSRTAGLDIRQEVRFAFGHKNGRQHVFESVALKNSAYNFYAKAEAAYNADRSINLLAMYPGSRFGGADSELKVIETFGHAIDIDDEGAASQAVAELVHP